MEENQSQHLEAVKAAARQAAGDLAPLYMPYYMAYGRFFKTLGDIPPSEQEALCEEYDKAFAIELENLAIAKLVEVGLDAKVAEEWVLGELREWAADNIYNAGRFSLAGLSPPLIAGKTE